MPSASLRVLILGSNGGLGRSLTRQLAMIGDVVAWTRAELDLMRIEDIGTRLEAEPFDVLINPAGITSPDECAQHPELAKKINTEAPRELARVCHRMGRRLIHFSTDYVFDGSKLSPWDEDDPTNPINRYGLTKRDGELAVLKACPQALVARVSWLFGPDKSSHPDQIIAKALQSEKLSAIANKTSSPTFTRDLSDWIQKLVICHPEVKGILHLCNQGSASWRQWGEAALEIANRLGLPVLTQKLSPSALENCQFFKDPRPPHTSMSTARFTKLTGISPRPWKDALEEHLHNLHAELAFSSVPH